MRFSSLVLVFSLSFLALTASAEDTAAVPVVSDNIAETAPAETVPTKASVNGVTIDNDLMRAYMAENAGNTMLQNPGMAMQNVVLLELLNQEAVKQGLLNDAALQAKIKVQTMTAVADALLNKVMAENPVADAAVEAIYQQQVVAQMQNEYRASHILVSSKEEADSLRERVVKGEDFATLAKEFSKDPGSAPEGGDLGYFTASDMVPEFSAAVAEATRNEVTPVVQTQFGYHLILVTDSRTQTPPALEEIRPQIVQLLQRQMLQNYVNNLVNAADIVMP
jgi:peptidyl-prolyl cis-trans isomerase C